MNRSRAARIARHDAIAATLARSTEAELGAFVDGATGPALSIGGATAVADVDGTPVFVKRVALTELEQRPEHVDSTANVFGLPLFYQYGVGSAGFGVWREVAALRRTTEWVLAGVTESFPLLHHVRVVPGPPPGPPADRMRAEIEPMVAFWAGSDAVRARLEAIAVAPASVILVLEHVPHSLEDWLAAQVAAGDDAARAACAMVEHGLAAAAAVMDANGLQHLDAHFRNIVTDGTQLYLADLGLALASWFELSPDETAFFARHRGHDRAYVMTQLVNWLERTGLAGRAAWAAEVVARHAPVAAIMNAFYQELHRERRTAVYPADAIARADQ